MTEIPQCTAEQVLDSVEAIVLAGKAEDAQFIAKFTGNAEQATCNALKVAVELGLLIVNRGKYLPTQLVSHFFGAATESTRIDILRAFLESNQPYIFFKRRLSLHNDARRAARETISLFQMSDHEEEVKETLTSLGRYCGSLVYEAKTGLRVAKVEDQETYLSSFDQLSTIDATVEDFIHMHLDEETFEFIQDEKDRVITNLRAAIKKVEEKDKADKVIQNVAKAIENFQDKLASCQNPPITLTGTGIIQKANDLKSKGLIASKHLGIFNFLGQYRNAADHGKDKEVGAEWKIRDNSGRLTILVALALIRSLTVYHLSKKCEL